MKSPVEIKNKFKEGFDNDVFGFGTGDILDALTFDEAKEYLKQEYIEKENAAADWEAKRLKTDDDVKAKMLDYLPFAWGKAEDCRGLSADRSIRHFAAWAWLIDDDFYKEIEYMYENDYAPYGEPILAYISNKLGYER